MKNLIALIISGALVISSYGQTRSVLVGTNGAVVAPTNFWSANASNATAGIGLGTAATNPASAFQPSSTVLSNLASSNGVNLTNIPVAGVVGALATNGSATNLVNFPASLLTTNGNGGGLTNLTAANITGTVALASNVTGVVAISNGGTGATNAATARSGLGLGFSALTNTNESDFRTAIGLGNLFTNTVYSTQTAVFVNTNFFATNGQAVFTNLGTDYLEFRTLFIVGTNATNISFEDPLARTNFIRGLGLGPTNNVTFNNITISDSLLTLSYGPEDDVFVRNDSGVLELESSSQITAFSPISFNNTTNAATTRDNLGLPWSGLTNTNAATFRTALFGTNTNPVLVNTNGEVVSPTNFWQVSPANTRVQIVQPVVNATNAATNARNLFLYSLAISTTGVTNTIQLPTNETFLGDVATVIHEGPTNSITAVRQIGSGTNIITLNQFQEAVKFIYEAGGWRLADNLSFVEAIYFSGTNAAANAAASRTNLGLGWIALTNTQSTLYSGVATSILGFAPEIQQSSTNLTGYNVLSYTNTNTLVVPANILISGDAVPAPRSQKSVELNGTVTIRTPFSSPTTIYANNSITVTDDSTYTNALVSFGSNSVTFSNVTASGTLTATSTVTAKTNLVVEGFVDFSTNHTNSNPATNNQINDFIEIRVGTNQFWLPVYK